VELAHHKQVKVEIRNTNEKAELRHRTHDYATRMRKRNYYSTTNQTAGTTQHERERGTTPPQQTIARESGTAIPPQTKHAKRERHHKLTTVTRVGTTHHTAPKGRLRRSAGDGNAPYHHDKQRYTAHYLCGAVVPCSAIVARKTAHTKRQRHGRRSASQVGIVREELHKRCKHEHSTCPRLPKHGGLRAQPQSTSAIEAPNQH
jgi:hypothetical protein